MCRVTMGHLRVTMGHLRVTVGHPWVTMGHLRLAIGYLKATVVHIRVTLGHLRVTIGHPRVTIGHLRVIMGHLRSAIGYLVAKHKANTTELHLKVRQTCSILKSITGSTRLVFYPHGDLRDMHITACVLFCLFPCILDRLPSRPNDGPQAGDQAQAVGGGRRPPARPASAI